MGYPATLELDAPTRVANWRPLVHWLLAIPHLLIANVLSNLGSVVALVSWFQIVFTGALSPGLANLQCLVIRYNARAYSYAGWLRETYPPFEFAMTPDDPGDDPVRVDLRPELEDRNRVTVGLRLIWVIPGALFAAVLAVAAFFVVLASFFAVLFTGAYPEGMRGFVVGVGRYVVRLSAYAYVLTDEYPPFSLEP